MDFRYEEAARYKAKYCTVMGFTSLPEKVGELVKSHGVKQVYMECEELSVAQARTLEKALQKAGAQAVLDDTLDEAVREQRMIKSPEEVKKIEASQEITDAAFQHILSYIKEGVTERELALEIEFFMRRQGAEGNAFDPIVAAGKNGSQCHAVPSDYALQKGDFITMDTGALLDGYNSDMTRTVALGKVSDEQRAVYEKVLEAHLAVFGAVKPGVPCCDVDKVARDIIEKDYPGTFGHGLGHGVGFQIHEWPRFSRLDKTPCAEGHGHHQRARHLCARQVRRAHRGYAPCDSRRLPQPDQVPQGIDRAVSLAAGAAGFSLHSRRKYITIKTETIWRSYSYGNRRRF